MKLFIIASLLVVTISASNLEEQGAKFQVFKLEHNKTYRNQAEETKRFNIFNDNLRSIDEHNALYEQGLVSYRRGVNIFSDMTQEEFTAFLTLSSSDKPNINGTKHVKTGLAVPDSIDWRTKGQVTGIKYQGQCGSCWAFSVTGAVEAAYYRQTGKLVSLSEQQLIDCTTDFNKGCGGGYRIKTFDYVQKYGLESEDRYPYTGTDDTCSFSSSDIVTKISSLKLCPMGDEGTLLEAVGTIGPVSVGMDANYLASYETGIYDDDECDDLLLNHAVLAVGYGSENGKDYWVIKNSWGTSWGEEGYFRIARGKNECGIARDASYPVCN